jgi:hypothetical protein
LRRLRRYVRATGRLGDNRVAKQNVVPHIPGWFRDRRADGDARRCGMGAAGSEPRERSEHAEKRRGSFRTMCQPQSFRAADSPDRESVLLCEMHSLNSIKNPTAQHLADFGPTIERHLDLSALHSRGE